MAQSAALRLVEGSSMDKSKALDAALAQIERNFGKGSIMRLGKNDRSMDVETIPSGSLGLDIALGVGGLPRGRVVEIYGPESSGKTTLALHTVAEAQKKGGICAFVDAEHALDPVYARKLGVNVDDLLISQPDTGEQALEIADTLVRSGAIDVLVIDSVAVEASFRGRALKLPRQEFQLLKFLAERPGRVFTREQLLSRVWGYRYAGGTRTVDIHVRRLRAKLGPGSVMIETVRHVGYKLRAPGVGVPT